MARVRAVTGVVILVVGLAASSAAQGTGDIVGRVADSSGGVLPGVAVTATSLATNISRTTVTSETGDYAFTLLPIGFYEVKTELTGFKTQTARVTLSTGDRARVDVRLELGTGHARSPLWSPDGRRIVFGSTREGNAGIFVQAADGSGGAERLTASEPGVEHTPGAWSRDGKTIVFMSVKTGIKDTIWTVGVRGDHKDQIVAVAGSNQMDPTLSPDGRWLAFSSEGEAGESIMNVFVQPFPANGAKYQISRNGGDMPVWSPDGQRLFFRKPISRRLVSVRIRSQPSFSVDDAVALGVDGLVTDAGYDLVPGRGFVVPVPVGQRETPGRGSSHRIDVVLNSFEGIQRAVRRERDSIGQ